MIAPLAHQLLQHLAALEPDGGPARYLVAFSGGLDSTVLLHALWSVREQHGTPIVAVHVNHALQAEAARWQAHCRRFAEGLGIELHERTIDVPANDSRGIEAAARELRYRVLAGLTRPGDRVLTAHHEDDQAETLLLNLLRGSGPAGLAGIGRRQPLGAGLLLRPLVDISRAEIAAYAAAHALTWCEDPSNADSRFDRNFLRREILPALRRRWPAVSARLARSAGLLAESAELEADLAALDLAALGEPARLSAAALAALSSARQRNVLRHALRHLGLPPAPASRLEQVVREVIPAPEDARPLVRWPGAEVRRYRGRVYLLPESQHLVGPEAEVLRADGRAVRLGTTLGRLVLQDKAGGGIDPALAGEGLRIAFRTGGEKFRPAGRGHTHPLKKLLQEAGVVPWMREFLPLLYAGDRLVAVGDLWIADDARRAPGYAVRWLDKPALY